MELIISFLWHGRRVRGFLDFEWQIDDEHHGGTATSGRVRDNGWGFGAAEGDFPIPNGAGDPG
jgi:hypothetical protein